MYTNPDIPTTSFGWNAFTYQPYDQMNNSNAYYYNGGGVPNPFANTAAPSDSRRQIGQQFAQNWNGQAQPQGYGYQSPYQPAQPQPQQTLGAAPVYPGSTFGLGNSMLSPNAFNGIAQNSPFGGSPAPAFDCIYNTNQPSAWDKSSNQTPAWNNPYTQERKPVPPSIDWTATNKPQPVGYGYGYSNSCNRAQFAQPDDWMAQAKQNFAANL